MTWNGELKERTPSCNSVVVVNKKKFMSKLKKMKLPNMKVKGDKNYRKKRYGENNLFLLKVLQTVENIPKY